HGSSDRHVGTDARARRRQTRASRRCLVRGNELPGFPRSDALAWCRSRMIIAIDGPAASGKGTIARRLAKHYGFPHLDTGLLYRAVAKAVLDAGDKLDDRARVIAAALAVDPSQFDEAQLKTHAVGEAASIV